jgi:anti-anti-sigma regulatory factor
MSFVTVSQAQGREPVTVLHIHDRINLGNVHEMDKAARDAYAAGARNLVIDLAEAPSITSAGLGALLALYKLLGRDTPSGDPQPVAAPDKPWKSTRLKLCNVSTHVREVLTIAGMNEYLEIHEGVAAAVASF